MFPSRLTKFVLLLACILVLICAAKAYTKEEGKCMSSCAPGCYRRSGKLRDWCVNEYCHNKCTKGRRALFDQEDSLMADEDEAENDDEEIFFSVMEDILAWSDSSSSSSALCVDAWDGLRLRSSAGCSASIVTVLSHGTQLTRVGSTYKNACGYKWYKVQRGSTVGWAASSFLKSCGGSTGGGGSGSESGGDRGARIVAFARAQLGKRYVWAGNGPDAWDCSGLVKAAYAQVGIDVPRGTSAYPGPNLKRTNSPKVGDVVGHTYPGHVAIYIGNNQVIHAMNPSLGVRQTELSKVQMNGAYQFWTPK